MNTVDDYLDEYGTQMSRESYDDVVDKLVSVGLLEAYEDRVEGVDAAIDSLKLTEDGIFSLVVLMKMFSTTVDILNGKEE